MNRKSAYKDKMPDELKVWEDPKAPYIYLGDGRMHIAGTKYHHDDKYQAVVKERDEAKRLLIFKPSPCFDTNLCHFKELYDYWLKKVDKYLSTKDIR